MVIRLRILVDGLRDERVSRDVEVALVLALHQKQLVLGRLLIRHLIRLLQFRKPAVGAVVAVDHLDLDLVQLAKEGRNALPARCQRQEGSDGQYGKMELMSKHDRVLRESRILILHDERALDGAD